MKNLLALILLIASFVASAQTTTVEGSPNVIFRPMSKKHVDMAIARGFTKVENLDLIKLSQEMDTVEWRTFDLGFLIGSGRRSSSIYIVKDKMVVINLYALKNLEGKPIPLLTWPLHEAMGALGYSDENYELSTAISFLATTNVSNPSDFVKTNFSVITRTTENQLYAMSGGATVVGGGGDAALIHLKQLLIQRFIKENENSLPRKELIEGVQKMIVQKIEFKETTDNSGYADFKVYYDGDTILCGAGAQLMVDILYSEKMLDNILSMLQL